MDLLRRWRRGDTPADPDPEATTFVIVPLFGAKPTTGFRAGAAGLIEFPLGDPTETRISSLSTAATISTKKQVGVFFTPALYGASNGWQMQGDNHFNATENGNVPLGSTESGATGDLNFDSVRLFNALSWRLTGPLYAGVGLYFARQSNIRAADDDLSDWDTSPFVEYSTANGFSLTRQIASGLGLTAILDSRDNQNDATHGWYVFGNFRTHFKDFLGGDSTWQRLTLDLRTYRPLSADGRQHLAVWALTDLVTGGTAPYLDLPATGTDARGRSARGYAEGEIRGRHLVYGEVEYRRTVTANGLFGFVVFVNGTTVGDPTTDASLFASFAPAGGAGLRLLLQKRSRTSICVDVAWGRDRAGAIYVGITDAF
jgi:outer membrane protein assembly factor BamA